MKLKPQIDTDKLVTKDYLDARLETVGAQITHVTQDLTEARNDMGRFEANLMRGLDDTRKAVTDSLSAYTAQHIQLHTIHEDQHRAMARRVYAIVGAAAALSGTALGAVVSHYLMGVPVYLMGAGGAGVVFFGGIGFAGYMDTLEHDFGFAVGRLCTHRPVKWFAGWYVGRKFR
jgi:hypothetical protein